MRPFGKSSLSVLFVRLIVCSLLLTYYRVVYGNKTKSTFDCFFTSRTRQNSNCYGGYYDVDSTISRAGGVPISSQVCVFHKQKIVKQNQRCSCPSTWGHSKKLHQHPIPQRLYELFDNVGEKKRGYRRGTQWCNKCKQKAEIEFGKVQRIDPKPKRQVRLTL